MKFLFCSLIILLICFNLFSQKDSSKFHVLGLESGYFNYGSIDEIFTPYIYSGSTWNYGIYTRKYNSKSIQETKLNLAWMYRKPQNVSIPEFYYISTYDASKIYKVKSEDYFRKTKTTFINFSYSYLRKFDIHFIPTDKIYLGFITQNAIIFRQHIEDHELISFSLSPSFFYVYPISKKSIISLQTNLSLVAVNLRKPYSGASAQVSDVFENYVSYFYKNSSLNFFNTYFNLFTRINYETSLHKRFKLNLYYDFAYVRSSEPRKLTSVTNLFGLGMHYKFGSYGKK